MQKNNLTNNSKELLVKMTISYNKYGLIYRKYSLSTSKLECYYFPRKVIEFNLKMHQSSKMNNVMNHNSGVYLLVNKYNHKIYVGQTNNISARIGQHLENNEKKWFNDAYFFGFEGKNMSNTIYNYLESELIKTFNNNNKWNIENKVPGNVCRLSKEDQIECECLFNDIRNYLFAMELIASKMSTNIGKVNKYKNNNNTNRFNNMTKPYYYNQYNKTNTVAREEKVQKKKGIIRRVIDFLF